MGVGMALIWAWTVCICMLQTLSDQDLSHLSWVQIPKVVITMPIILGVLLSELQAIIDAVMLAKAIELVVLLARYIWSEKRAEAADLA